MYEKMSSEVVIEIYRLEEAILAKFLDNYQDAISKHFGIMCCYRWLAEDDAFAIYVWPALQVAEQVGKLLKKRSQSGREDDIIPFKRLSSLFEKSFKKNYLMYRILSIVGLDNFKACILENKGVEFKELTDADLFGLTVVTDLRNAAQDISKKMFEGNARNCMVYSVLDALYGKQEYRDLYSKGVSTFFVKNLSNELRFPESFVTENTKVIEKLAASFAEYQVSMEDRDQLEEHFNRMIQDMPNYYINYVKFRKFARDSKLILEPKSQEKMSEEDLALQHLERWTEEELKLNQEKGQEYFVKKREYLSEVNSFARERATALESDSKKLAERAGAIQSYEKNIAIAVKNRNAQIKQQIQQMAAAQNKAIMDSWASSTAKGLMNAAVRGDLFTFSSPNLGTGISLRLGGGEAPGLSFNHAGASAPLNFSNYEAPSAARRAANAAADSALRSAIHVAQGLSTPEEMAHRIGQANLEARMPHIPRSSLEQNMRGFASLFSQPTISPSGLTFPNVGSASFPMFQSQSVSSFSESKEQAESRGTTQSVPFTFPPPPSEWLNSAGSLSQGSSASFAFASSSSSLGLGSSSGLGQRQEAGPNVGTLGAFSSSSTSTFSNPPNNFSWAEDSSRASVQNSARRTVDLATNWEAMDFSFSNTSGLSSRTTASASRPSHFSVPPSPIRPSLYSDKDRSETAAIYNRERSMGERVMNFFITPAYGGELDVGAEASASRVESSFERQHPTQSELTPYTADWFKRWGKSLLGDNSAITQEWKISNQSRIPSGHSFFEGVREVHDWPRQQKTLMFRYCDQIDAREKEFLLSNPGIAHHFPDSATNIARLVLNKMPDTTIGVIGELASIPAVTVKAPKVVGWLYRAGKVEYNLFQFDKKASTGHIFSKIRGLTKEGHLPDTQANRKMLVETWIDKKNFIGIDKYGSEWYAKTQPNGAQSWVRIQNGEMRSGGLNEVPQDLVKIKALFTEFRP